MLLCIIIVTEPQVQPNRPELGTLKCRSLDPNSTFGAVKYHHTLDVQASAIGHSITQLLNTLQRVTPDFSELIRSQLRLALRSGIWCHHKRCVVRSKGDLISRFHRVIWPIGTEANATGAPNPKTPLQEAISRGTCRSAVQSENLLCP